MKEFGLGIRKFRLCDFGPRGWRGACCFQRCVAWGSAGRRVGFWGEDSWAHPNFFTGFPLLQAPKPSTRILAVDRGGFAGAAHVFFCLTWSCAHGERFDPLPKYVRRCLGRVWLLREGVGNEPRRVRGGEVGWQSILVSTCPNLRAQHMSIFNSRADALNPTSRAELTMDHTLPVTHTLC